MYRNLTRVLAAIPLVAIALIATGCGGSSSRGLPAFKAETGKQVKMGMEIRMPYQSVNSYWGYVKPGEAPDEVRDNKKFYYLYVWVPLVAPELGIRMVSSSS